MKSSPKTVQIAEPLWRALEVMSEQMGVDKDSLVNQAVYALARMHGFITPPQLKVTDEAASVLDAIPDPMPSIKPGPPVPTPPEPAPTVPERDRGPLPSPPVVDRPAAVAAPAPAPPQVVPKPDPSQGPSEAERAELRAKAIEQMKAIAAEVERVVAIQADTPIGASDDDEDREDEESEESEESDGSEGSDESDESGEADQPEQEPPPPAADDEAPEAPEPQPAAAEAAEDEPHTGEHEQPPEASAPEHAAKMKSDLEELGLGEGPDEPSNLSPLPEEPHDQPEGIPTALVKPREAVAQAKDVGLDATALRPKVKTDDRSGIPTMGVHVNVPDRPDGAEEINVTGTVRRLGLKIAKAEPADPDEPEEPQERTQIVRKERPKLFITRAGEDPVEITAERYLIGRGPHCDLVIESNRVSREHAAVFNDDQEGFVVEDLGSSNGTWFKEERVQKHVIEDGDEVFFGNEAVRFNLQAPGASNKRGARRDGRVQA